MDKINVTDSQNVNKNFWDNLEQARVRIVERVLLILVVLTTLFGCGFVILYFMLRQPWQWTVLFFAIAQAICFFGIGYYLARHQQSRLAVYFATLAINVAVVVGAAMFSDWLMQSILLSIVGIGFARLVGDRAQNRWIITFSGLAMVLAVVGATGGMIEKYTIPTEILTTSWIVYIVFALGVLALVLDLRDQSYEQALDVAYLYAQQMGNQQAELETHTQELAKRARYLQATAEVARDAASAERDVRDLLTRVARLISEQFGFYHTGIFLVDRTREWAVLQAASSEGGQRMLTRGHRLRVGHTGTVGYVTNYGIPRIALDVGEDAVFFNNPDLPETRSAMTLPLRARGEIIGALDVQSKVAGAFTDEDAAVIQVLADQVAMAISNARLFEKVQQSIEEERLVYGEASRESWQRLLRTHANLGYRYERSTMIPIAEMDATLSETLEQEEAVLAELTLPIRVREQTLGEFRAHKQHGLEWTLEEVALVRALIEQLEVALDSARLYQDTQRRASREQLTRQITDNIRASVTVEDAIKRAVREITRVLEAAETVARIGPERILMPGDAADKEGFYGD